MMTDAVNENTKEEEETEESESDSEHEDPQPVTNIRLLYFFVIHSLWSWVVASRNLQYIISVNQK